MKSKRWAFAYYFLRMLNWIITHSLYSMRVIGRENIPTKGGALLVCNHVSYVDPLIVFGTVKRHVRFMTFQGIYNNFFSRPVCKITGAIPVSLYDKPKAILKSLQQAKQAIEQGHIVCIFAEGGLTRTGNMLPFTKGFEYIMKDLDAPIIPMHIDRIWGSIFSYWEGKYFWKMPKMIPYPVTISFGKPMPASSRNYQVREAVQVLSADAFKLRGQDQKKLHIAFIDEVKKHPFKFCMADSTKLKLNYLQVLVSMLLFSKKILELNKNKFREEEMIGVLLPTSVAASIVNGAIFCAGKIPVNLNFTTSKESIDSSIKQCRMNMIITSRKFIEKIKFEQSGHMVFIEDLKAQISKKEKVLTSLAGIFLPSFLIKELFVKGDRINIDSIATVIFSSGSTGKPKGIMLSHGNIFSNIEGIYQVLNLEHDDVIMGILPFFHSFGFTANLCFPLGAGLSVVYHSNPLDAACIGSMIQKYKAAIIMGTPTFFSAYAKKCSKEQFSSIRFAITGAEKLKESISRDFFEKFGIVPFEGYGATELSPIVSLGVPDYINKQQRIKQVGFKPGTVGHPIPGVAVRIVDPNTLKPLPLGEQGLLLVKGPNVMKGYLFAPQTTKEVIKDGWYVTGDIAKIDEHGFIQIMDRISRFSKIAGEMVPHVKIEDEIMKITGVSEPFCAVTTVPDERKGEKLVVLCQRIIDTDWLWKKLNACPLPKLWIPKKEDFYYVDEIPLLGSGKLDLKKIKSMAQEIAN